MYLIISFLYCIMHLLTSQHLMEVIHFLIGQVLCSYAEHIHKWLSLAAQCLLSMLWLFLTAVFDHFFVLASSSIYYHWYLEQTLLRFLMKKGHLAHQSVIHLLVSQILRLLILSHNSWASYFTSHHNIALPCSCQSLSTVVTMVMGGLQDFPSPIWSKADIFWILLVRPGTLLSLLKTVGIHRIYQQ